MTTMVIPSVGASSAWLKEWDAIEWHAVKQQVKRLQMRIAKATREGKHGKAKSLQWILTHSWYGKLLAVRRVVQNSGAKTPGVDGVTWRTLQQKISAVKSLQRRGYKPQPLRRVYIPKKNGKRPLDIPCMVDRAYQALYLLALEPISETLLDNNMYGFRPMRSTADAIEQCFKALAKKHSSQWILEGDIRNCFNSISHDWLKENIPTDKTMLKKWLSAGYIDRGTFYPLLEGAQQGSIISPTLMNLTLKGLEQSVKKIATPQDKVNVVSYADDFIITGASQEVLENKIKPAVIAFLKERGLELSEEKTKITHIEEGFELLGFNVRKYKGKLLIKPAKKNVKSFLAKIRSEIKSKSSTKTEHLIWQLNPMIRGWANYYRHVVAKKTFKRVDHDIFCAIRQWAKRRHPNKNVTWVRKKYFRTQDNENWVFHSKVHTKEGNSASLDLFKASKVAIKRHIKIKGEATPYDPTYKEYFLKRKRDRQSLSEKGHKESEAQMEISPSTQGTDAGSVNGL